MPRNQKAPPSELSLSQSETLEMCSACGELQGLDVFRVPDGAGGSAVATRCATCRETTTLDPGIDWDSIPPKHMRLLRGLAENKAFRSAAIDAGFSANTSQGAFLKKYPATAKVFQQLLVAEGLTLERVTGLMAQNARAVKPFYDPAANRTTFLPDAGVRHRASELAAKAWGAMPEDDSKARGPERVAVFVTNLFGPTPAGVEGLSNGKLVAEAPRVIDVAAEKRDPVPAP